MKTKIKNILKKSKLISDVNANIKCKALKKQYQFTIDKYKKIEQKHTLEELMLQKGFTKEWAENVKGKKLNIYFIGTDEFQDKSGFIQDLSKAANLTYFIRYDGVYGQYDSSQNINRKNRILNTKKVIEDIEKLI